MVGGEGWHDPLPPQCSAGLPTVKSPGVFEHAASLERAVWRGEYSKNVTQYAALMEGTAVTDALPSAKQEKVGRRDFSWFAPW